MSKYEFRKKNYRSDISGFYKLSISERLRLLSEMMNFSKEELLLLQNLGYFKPSQIDTLIENVISSFQLPLGIAFNFRINDKDYLIPMAIEEPSVVAAASNAAKMARIHGGFYSNEVKSVMISQIQITKIDDLEGAKKSLFNNKDDIINLANQQDPLLNELGGGAVDLEVRELSTNRGIMLIVHLLVNVLDAMGANVVNTMAEAVTPYLEELTGGKI